MPVYLSVGLRRFVLDPDSDHDRLRTEVVEAVRVRGSFVHIVHAGGSTDAMITPHSTVFFDYRPPVPERGDAEAYADTFLDFDDP